MSDSTWRVGYHGTIAVTFPSEVNLTTYYKTVNKLWMPDSRPQVCSRCHLGRVKGSGERRDERRERLRQEKWDRDRDQGWNEGTRWKRRDARKSWPRAGSRWWKMKRGEEGCTDIAEDTRVEMKEEEGCRRDRREKRWWGRGGEVADRGRACCGSPPAVRWSRSARCVATAGRSSASCPPCRVCTAGSGRCWRWSRRRRSPAAAETRTSPSAWPHEQADWPTDRAGRFARRT